MANLIAYFSRKGQNYFSGQIRRVEKGNTEYVAEYIQQAVGGDLFETVPAKDYPADYYECTDVAKAELRAKARPEVESYVEDMGRYDTVFVGYPNWWGTCPMCVFTFLERYDWAGKRVVPFCTNEGSGMGGSVKMIRQACKGATVEDGLAIVGGRAAACEPEAAAWAKRMA